jgi:hypothetical protein
MKFKVLGRKRSRPILRLYSYYPEGPEERHVEVESGKLSTIRSKLTL